MANHFHMGRGTAASLALALGMTVVFWGELWIGGALTGGDIEHYSLPQKAYLSECLHQGFIPLWNARTANGYPILGESQTAAFYPLHILLYGTCSVSTAWALVLLIHYMAAYLATVWLARVFGIQAAGANLAAIVYVYGWFPARATLDWAILGGVYLPLALGCAAMYLRTGHREWAGRLSLALGLQLLGGHYQIAFITWLILGAFCLGNLCDQRLSAASLGNSAHKSTLRKRITKALTLLFAFSLGVALAAITLLPSWELKSRSERVALQAHYLCYGHLPPIYISQIVAPYYWYSPALDRHTALNSWRLGSVLAPTNEIEAHLYFGQIPVLLIVAFVVRAICQRAMSAWTLFWIATAVVATVYATGWLLPVMDTIPGFNFFRAPARFGVVVTLAAALLAGQSLDWVTLSMPAKWQLPCVSAALLLTVVDLRWLPAPIKSFQVRPSSPMALIDHSPIRSLLRQESSPVRLYAPWANIPNLLDVSSTPGYLGMAPKEYSEERFAMPKANPPGFFAYSIERYNWLCDSGVTHILSTEPLEDLGWKVDCLWSGVDPFLKAATSPTFHDTVYLYRLRGAPGRARWEGTNGGEIGTIIHSPHEVVVDVAAKRPGRLILTDLDYPGWTVSLDGAVVESPQRAGMFRAVEIPAGQHRVTWSYRPRSVVCGGAVSICAFAAVLIMCMYRRRSIPA